MSQKIFSTIAFIVILMIAGYFAFTSLSAGQKPANSTLINKSGSTINTISKAFSPDLEDELAGGKSLSIVQFEDLDQSLQIPKTFDGKVIDDDKVYQIGTKYLGLVTSTTNPGILVIYNPLTKNWQKLFQPVNAKIGGKNPNNSIRAIWAGGSRIRLVFVDQFSTLGSEGTAKIFDSRDGKNWSLGECVGWTASLGQELIDANFQYEEAVASYTKKNPNQTLFYTANEDRTSFSVNKDGKKTLITSCLNLLAK